MGNKVSELIGFNSVNVFALGMSLTQIESLLTILVLVSVLVYNIKKIRHE